MKDPMNNGIYQAGQRLRQIREELGLTLKEVEKLSQCLAEEMQITSYLITAARVSQVENSNSVPSLYKLATLSFIYKLPLTEMFRIYGIDSPTSDEPVPAAGPSSPLFNHKRFRELLLKLLRHPTCP